MSDPKKYTEKTEVETETTVDTDAIDGSEYKKETTVKTERTVEKEEEEREPIVIVEEN